MMLKVIALLVKKPSTTRNQLIDHYEHQHVPLITSLAPAPAGYRRNYVVPGDAGSDVDVVTELSFADIESYKAWLAVVYAPGSGVAEDEATFLDRSRTRSFIVEEHAT
ncbi:EthD domain-containing protein [Nocardia sp. NPDC020380]|uniref:EthD domain-containing protein n=1 Tax=Nocardia sp. NPDC020380 TaxID=3364309 RepID=UPI0037ADCD8D